jgi:hypothetical protein
VVRTVRATDTAGRYGGDEFVVLLPETDAEGAFVVAEKLRRDISQLAIRVHDRNVRTSVSLGLVAYPEDGTTIEALLSAVDAAMYEAKRRGKNQIVGYTTRTERVATAIGAEQQGPTPRQRPPRPEESRSAEIGLMPPSTVPESHDHPDASAPTHPTAGPAHAASMPSGPVPSLPFPNRVVTPIRPRDAVAAGRPPVPPAGSASWSRGPTTRTATGRPRDPGGSKDRQYVAFPIAPDDPAR